MASYGMVAMAILFSTALILNIGSGGQYGTGFATFTSEITQPGANVWESLVDSFFDTEVLLASGVVVGVVALMGGTAIIPFLIPAFMLAAVMNWFLSPIGLIRTIGLPTWVGWFAFGFYNLLLIVALLSFIRGKDV